MLTGGEPDAAPGLDVREVTAGWALAGVRRAAARIRALAPDLAHVQFAPSAYRFHREDYFCDHETTEAHTPPLVRQLERLGHNVSIQPLNPAA